MSRCSKQQARNSPIRTFIAIDLPPSVQESIQNQTARLRQLAGDDVVRWVPAKNMHLTLKFLGDTPASHLSFLKQLLTNTAGTPTPFEIQFGGLGSFPNLKRPRVIWAGIHATASLLTLQKEIEESVSRLGYEKDTKTFSPHLTLGRVRQGISAKDLHRVSTALSEIQLGRIATVRVDSIHLYQSDLNPEGSIYTKIFSTPLR